MLASNLDISQNATLENSQVLGNISTTVIRVYWPNMASGVNNTGSIIGDTLDIITDKFVSGGTIDLKLLRVIAEDIELTSDVSANDAMLLAAQDVIVSQVQILIFNIYYC